MADEGLICGPGGRGIVLPLSSAEHEWPQKLRCLLYGAGLVYAFVGVAQAVDVFMVGVTRIIGRRRRVRGRDGKMRTVHAWNQTLARITLVALGSSAPEIFLSLIELLGNEMYAGELGSSTIVGSAAFNLFCVVGACIVYIPHGQQRKVSGSGLFYVAAFFSVFAYLWLVIVLLLSTPSVIEIWEAVITLAFFFVMVTGMHYVDVFGFTCKPILQVLVGGAGELGEDERPIRELQMQAGNAELAKRGSGSGSGGGGTARASVRQSEAQRMLLASQAQGNKEIGARQSVRASLRQGGNGSWPRVRYSQGPAEYGRHEQDLGPPCANEVQFLVDRQCASLGLQTKFVNVHRSGDCSVPVRVKYAVLAQTQPMPLPTSQGQPGSEVRAALPASLRSAVLPAMVPVWLRHTQGRKSTAAFRGAEASGQRLAEGEVCFYSGDTLRSAEVQCPTSRLGECFLVVLESVTVDMSLSDLPDSLTPPDYRVVLGGIRTTHITVEPEGPGRLLFHSETLSVQARSDTQNFECVVLRRGGCTGEVSCKVRAEAFTAVPGVDFEAIELDLRFEEGVTEQTISLDVYGKPEGRASDEFFVLMEDWTGRTAFDPSRDGGEEFAILTVFIEAVSAKASLAKRLDALLNVDQCLHGLDNWKWQFSNAIYVNGSIEEQREASLQDCFAHCLALPWKLLLTVVPPAELAGGWLCCLGALLYIALVMIIVHDLAKLFGCVAEVPETVVAITFVALGSSLSDLFLSLFAAKEDIFADATVFNILGSQIMNVFVGLGLPWTIGAIYWAAASSGATSAWGDFYPDRTTVVFVVEAQDLGFQVVLFLVLGTGAILLLLLRRNVVNAEFGGPPLLKWATGGSLAIIWLVYLLLTSWRTQRPTTVPTAELGAALGMGTFVALCAFAAPVVLLRLHGGESEDDETERSDGAGAKGSTDADDTDPEMSLVEVSDTQWTPLKRALRQDWDRLFECIPEKVRADICPGLEDVRRKMDVAMKERSELGLAAARSEGSKVVAAVVVEILEIHEEEVQEVLEGAAMRRVSTITSASLLLTRWFDCLCRVLSQIGDVHALAEALQMEAERNGMDRLLIGTRVLPARKDVHVKKGQRQYGSCVVEVGMSPRASRSPPSPRSPRGENSPTGEETVVREEDIIVVQGGKSWASLGEAEAEAARSIPPVPPPIASPRSSRSEAEEDRSNLRRTSAAKKVKKKKGTGNTPSADVVGKPLQVEEAAGPPDEAPGEVEAVRIRKESVGGKRKKKTVMRPNVDGESGAGAGAGGDGGADAGLAAAVQGAAAEGAPEVDDAAGVGAAPIAQQL